MPLNGFSLEEYRKLLLELVLAGYDFRFFDGIYDRNGVVFLRHDVDFCVRYAVEIAVLEYELGIRSTFFFLINSALYNLFASENLRAIKKIVDMGHMICLHADEEALQDLTPNDKRTYLKGQLTALTSVLPFANGHIISRHRPNLSKPSDWLPSEYLDVYSPPFFKDIEYASDSHGTWRYGSPTERKAFQKKVSFQLLTHPIWWTAAGETSSDKINDMLYERYLASKEYVTIYDFK